MPESLTFKQKGQINIVLKQEEQKSPPPLKKPFEERVRHQSLQQLERELDRLVGLKDIKQTVHEIYAWLYVNRLRKEHNLAVKQQTLHMLFKGNPGTGKTTVARILGKLFADMNILSKGHLIEAERADLVGEYIGQTAQKTRELIKKAQGGILFVDEAYSLGRGGEKDFGKEAIDTLVKHMEDKKDDFILILAGYSDEMDDFLDLNPGLPSRFPIILTFPNYNELELLEIAEQMIEDREYLFTEEARKKLQRHFRHKVLEEAEMFSNGRYVRNLIEKMIRKQAVRLVKEGVPNREALLTIRSMDITIEEEPRQTDLFPLTRKREEGD
ncbi:stage V sporulation protein K [Pullulanibacillus sp. KACC 23026]|uniref:stage V sporulation protein K n=1 Tax=Pullulanibacillus sp. KACC 23026 TaxID=3028315 RepID=UPI0023B0BC27|nr:stage V sporulation protein K [Pullulanibacillus sp. KACC 23026]WEG11539.1 stage V sporulation protein K [Pullulanibacillus sp. KACC 23026]